jgi:hypothetical protein
MTRTTTLLVAAAAALTVGVARGEEMTTFHGCADAAGQAVPSLLDTALERVVDTDRRGASAVIRYNPERLPELRPATRLFFYAHECARHELGLAAARTRTPDDARRADCAAIATLSRSRLLDAGEVAAVEGDPALTAEAWSLLPGPPRRLALGNCLAALAARPSLVSPAPHQPDWNTCVRGCGEALRACRTGARVAGAGDACQRTYEQCSSTCDARYPQ